MRRSHHKLPASEKLGGIEILRIPYFGSTRYPIALSLLRHIEQADLVHVHAIDFFFDYLAWTKPLHGRTLVASTHGGFFHTTFAARLKRLWFSTVTRVSMKSYAGVAAVSASISSGSAGPSDGDGLHRKWRERCEVLRCVLQQFPESDLLHRPLCQEQEDRPADRFCAGVAAARSRWRLTIAGRPGDLRLEDVSALVESAGLGDAIEVVPSPTDETVKALMRHCSFVASSSEYEGFGVAAVEGMSAGLFPLLSDIPPFRRLVARTGLGMIIDYRDRTPAARCLLRNLDENCFRLCGATGSLHAGRDGIRLATCLPGLRRALRGGDRCAVRTILDVPVQVRSFDEAVKLIDARYETREGSLSPSPTPIR